jgi:hypothetical protein
MASNSVKSIPYVYFVKIDHLGLKMKWATHAETDTDQAIVWHVDPLLGNDSVNTFPWQRTRRQQLDDFRCHATRCKYNNKGRGVFYVVRIYPLLGNGCDFMGPPWDYISGREQTQVSRRMRTRMERVLGRQGRRVRLKIDCWVIIIID